MNVYPIYCQKCGKMLGVTVGGASVQEAQTMARHSDINTTLKYAHNINRIKQAPEKKIDVLLNGIL